MLNVYDYVYLRVERKDPRESCYKLVPIAEGPYKVTKTHDKTDVIQKKDPSVEKVSLSRLISVPKPNSKEEMEKSLNTTKVKDKNEEYPAEEDIRLNDILTRDDEKDDTDESDHEEASSKRKKQKTDPKH